MYKYSFATLYTALPRAGPFPAAQRTSTPWQVCAAPSAHGQTQTGFVFTSVAVRSSSQAIWIHGLISADSRLWCFRGRKEATSLWPNYNLRDGNTNMTREVLKYAFLRGDRQTVPPLQAHRWQKDDNESLHGNLQGFSSGKVNLAYSIAGI